MAAAKSMRLGICVFGVASAAAGIMDFALAGIAILSGILDVLAARLLARMLLVFSVLVLAPGPLAHPRNHVAWGSNAYNLAAAGAAWIFAESIAMRRRERQCEVGSEMSLIWRHN